MRLLLLLLLAVLLSVRVRVVRCVRRRASDPLGKRDGQSHTTVIVWCPWLQQERTF